MLNGEKALTEVRLGREGFGEEWAHLKWQLHCCLFPRNR